jgi:hypothetical protein
MSKGSYVSKVQSDLAEYGPALDKLAAAVAAFQPADMQAVMLFVSQAQQQVLDHLYDETAVLKCIADWPGAKWEALWEGAVTHRQLTELQEQCDACSAQQQQLLLKTAESLERSLSSSSSGSSGSSRKKGFTPSRVTQLAAAAAAAQQTFAAVSSKLDAYQRQESSLEKRLKAQGVPYNGAQLVAGVKEAAVQLGVVFVEASLALLQASEQQLRHTRLQLLGSDGTAAAAAAGSNGSSDTAAGAGAAVGSLWGCAVRDKKQRERLMQQMLQQRRQHEQRRRQQLDDAVTFLFKLHQFAGGFDQQGLEAFCGLAEEYQRQQQNAAAVATV